MYAIRWKKLKNVNIREVSCRPPFAKTRQDHVTSSYAHHLVQPDFSAIGSHAQVLAQNVNQIYPTFYSCCTFVVVSLKNMPVMDIVILFQELYTFYCISLIPSQCLILDFLKKFIPVICIFRNF